MVGGAERHLWFNHNVVFRFGLLRMERCADVAAPSDPDRFILALPFGVPVLLLHAADRIVPTDAAFFGQPDVFQPLFGKVIFRNVCKQPLIPVHKAVATDFTEQGGQYFRSLLQWLHPAFYLQVAHTFHSFWVQVSAALTMAMKSSAFSDAPPISPPSTSGQLKSSSAFLGLQLPPYKI